MSRNSSSRRIRRPAPGNRSTSVLKTRGQSAPQLLTPPSPRHLALAPDLVVFRGDILSLAAAGAGADQGCIGALEGWAFLSRGAEHRSVNVISERDVRGRSVRSISRALASSSSTVPEEGHSPTSDPKKRNLDELGRLLGSEGIGRELITLDPTWNHWSAHELSSQDEESGPGSADTSLPPTSNGAWERVVDPRTNCRDPSRWGSCDLTVVPGSPLVQTKEETKYEFRRTEKCRTMYSSQNGKSGTIGTDAVNTSLCLSTLPSSSTLHGRGNRDLLGVLCVGRQKRESDSGGKNTDPIPDSGMLIGLVAN
ncbi:hypothetical protein BDK51DRAFT_37405 [Blyttiomyces helicus]|uniref:Uncharacterized protein n=1 Tax=Blyttiomyces helicus TaxID=388810 RepID=A0A4P9VZQ2_9FUNG|nr:hypothetical protein BDK51DRAFT_37405 [Blyttiomyces helicus]|eukprot:RKO85264.1 hypothetical protein BDK51DRAFT_37405 [Blyttiomyces helicus]